MNKKIIYIILVFVFIIFIIFLFFNKKVVKIGESGNTKTSQEIVDYILNISSYEANITVEVKSNKNSNKYILNQKYINPNKNTQEVVEPSNIAGVKIIKEENNLVIENSNLNLTTFYENYNYITDNCLDLNTFIDEYKAQAESTYEENDESIIMKTSSDSKYNKTKILYVDKKSYKPTKLEVKDTNQNTRVYILYNEVKINSIT